MFTTEGCKTLVHLHGVGHQEHKRFQEQTVNQQLIKLSVQSV